MGGWVTPYETPGTDCGEWGQPPLIIIKHFKLQKMQKYIITSGKWTSNENFSGYTLFGERVHIFGHQMASMQFDKEHTVFPFIAIAEKKSYSARMDSDGNAVGQAINDRLTATAVFKNEDAIVEAIAMTEGFEARIQRKVAKKVAALEFDIEPTREGKVGLTNAAN